MSKYLVDLLAVGLGNEHRGGLGWFRSMVGGQFFGTSVKASKWFTFVGASPTLEAHLAKVGWLSLCAWLRLTC